MVGDVLFRRAGESDIPVLARHHRMMFEEMRALGEKTIRKENCSSPECNRSVHFEQLETAHRTKLEQQLPENTCMAIIVEHRGEPVASGSVTVIQTVPVPEDPSFTVGFLHSVYTTPPMRGHGIASTILDHLLNYCRENKIHRVQLNASEAGRSIYRTKGFKVMDGAMILWL